MGLKNVLVQGSELYFLFSFLKRLVTKFEKLNPSLEPCHAFSEAIRIAPKLTKDNIIIVNSCGDAKKDRDILKKRLGKKI